MIKLNSSAHKIDTVFIVLLFTLLAATAFILILIGTKQYQATADAMHYNYEVRTATSYLTEKVHQNETDAGISVVDFEGGCALALANSTENGIYTTYIYYYDGSLREILVNENSVYSPESGQPIIEIGGFVPKIVHAGLLCAAITDTTGTTHSVYLKINTASGKDAT